MATSRRAFISRELPNLKGTRFRITSPQDRDYNCIAWAAEDTSRAWWPGELHWPAGVPEKDSIEAFVSAFETLGYSEINNVGPPEEGVARVALFGQASENAARPRSRGDDLRFI